jgi:ATP-dependent Clp protease adaptor protein ClpS
MRTNKENKSPDPADTDKDQRFSLILYNDDYHTYDYVIDALVKICGLDVVQATQCTFLVHFKEKCEVKKGSKTFLIPMQKALLKLDLRAVITN